MLFVNFLKKNAEAGQAFFKKLLLVEFTFTFKGTSSPGHGSTTLFDAITTTLAIIFTHLCRLDKICT